MAEELSAAVMVANRHGFGYVASVCSMCLRCFGRMLQVFHANVAKVDLDVVTL
jgi:hypothetical protein